MDYLHQQHLVQSKVKPVLHSSCSPSTLSVNIGFSFVRALREISDQHSHIGRNFLSEIANRIRPSMYEHMNKTPHLIQDAAPGALDDSVEVLLLLMDRDLFGDTADAKEAANFAANYKEAKSCRAYDTYRLLASMITFRSHMRILMSTVRVVVRV